MARVGIAVYTYARATHMTAPRVTFCLLVATRTGASKKEPEEFFLRPGPALAGTNNFSLGYPRWFYFWNFSDRTDWNLNDKWGPARKRGWNGSGRGPADLL